MRLLCLIFWLAIAFFGVFISSCSKNQKENSSQVAQNVKNSESITTKNTHKNSFQKENTMLKTSWSNKATIPAKYIHSGIGGKNISPFVKIPQIPKGTKSLLLVVVDHHKIAHDWIHWVALLEPSVKQLDENASANPPKDLKQLKNTWGNIGYEGPKPPPGAKHDYHIVLFALNKKPDLPDKPSWEQIVKVVKNVTLKKWEDVSYYGR